MKSLWKKILRMARRVVLWGEYHIPAGLRSVAGLLLVGGGFVGFLPVLGFWMIPAGLALIALDIPPLRHRVLAWCERGDDDSAAQ
ncbi:hypothetical protein [Desertibaculum subflavum]|uniref:hypothetical protein n=1 Tax=Desertibaculum subflavum TaxID=2268458 RepID=UPI0013C4FAFC